MAIDYSTLTLTDFIKLQDEINREIRARFEKQVALVFSDVVGSTSYFERFGAARGRAMLQRHLDLLDVVIKENSGRVVDTAGDGAFCVFPQGLLAVNAMVQLLTLADKDNAAVADDHRLGLRIGVHWGSVLTDGAIVTGDAVNFTARIASSAEPNQLRISRDLVTWLPPAIRLRCKALAPVQLKGIPDPVDLSVMEWRDPRVFASRIRIDETGEELSLPRKDVIAFGRLAEFDGRAANDIVLSHPDPAANQRLSRWHFELHRRSDGFYLQPVSRAATEVNGRMIARGQSVPVRPGSVVRLSKVLTLQLLTDPTALESMDSETVVVPEGGHHP